MKQKVIQKILGILLFGFGLILLTPIVVSILYNDQTYYSFVIAAFINLLIGFALWHQIEILMTSLKFVMDL